LLALAHNSPHVTPRLSRCLPIGWRYRHDDQLTFTAAAPLDIATITDRPKLHTALQQLVKGAYFGPHHEVGILSKGGLLPMLTVRQGEAAPYLMILRHDGQIAILDGDGKLRITEAATELIAAGMPPLDAKTIDDVQAHLRKIS
jgi:hypothetical protein